MLTKLLKYFKATGRIILPIAGGVLLLNFVSDLLGHYVNNTSHTMPWVGVFMGLLTLATFLGMLAVLAICFFASVQRYYELLGEQGSAGTRLAAHCRQAHLRRRVDAVRLFLLWNLRYAHPLGTGRRQLFPYRRKHPRCSAPAVILPPDPCTDCRCPAARLPGLRLCGDVYPA